MDIKFKFRVLEASLMDENMNTKIWITQIQKKIDYFW